MAERGDAIFANRCVNKFEELKSRKVTVLFVSHDLGLVKRLSNRAMLMLNGKVAAEGSPNDVVNRYVGLVHEWQRASIDGGRREGGLESSFRHGDGSSEVVGVAVLNSRGEETGSILSGERVTVRVRARFKAAVDDPTVGILVRNRLGVDVFGTNTRLEQKELGRFAAGDTLETDFSFECRLAQQEYTLTVATQHADGASQDWLDDVLSFRVVDPKAAAGVVNFETDIRWRRN